MKRYISSLLLGGLLFMGGLTSCMNDWDDADTKDVSVTSASVGQTNSSIYQLKTDYNSVFTAGTNNYQKITEDVILEGVVCANDISGNLYQTVLIRDIDQSKDASDVARDQCIVLGIRNTCLYPYFKLGQRIRINLNGLYIGVYSRVPKIGQPYKTSLGNWRLGPMLFDLVKSHIELVGAPDPNAPELVPVERDYAWLRATANRNLFYTPQLATVKGYIAEMQDGADKTPSHGEDLTATTGDDYSSTYEPLPKIFAPKCLRDDGYGVDRTIRENKAAKTGETTVAIRTSTSNDIGYARMPLDQRSYTGMLTYYSSWQIQLRDLSDIAPALDDYLLGKTDEKPE